jgi:hypothetical protein
LCQDSSPPCALTQHCTRLRPCGCLCACDWLLIAGLLALPFWQALPPQLLDTEPASKAAELARHAAVTAAECATAAAAVSLTFLGLAAQSITHAWVWFRGLAAVTHACTRSAAEQRRLAGGRGTAAAQPE